MNNYPAYLTVTPPLLEAPAMQVLPPSDPRAMTVAKAVENYLTLRLSEGLPPDGDTLRHLDLHLARRLCESFGNRPLSHITAPNLREWEKSLMNPKTGQPMGLITRRHHMIDVKTFFKRCHIERWIDYDPSRAVMLPPLEEETPHVIAVKEAFTYFRANRGHRSIARIALEAFGGLRYTSAAKLVKGDLNFEERGIEMAANKHKSGKRKYRQGHPANLWTWLRAAGDSCWDTTQRQYADDKAEMLAAAGLRPYQLKTEQERAAAKVYKNVWRHSFASYLLARTKSFDTVGYLMQHSRPSTTEIYEGMARERDAQLYFAITPTSVLLTWEGFVEHALNANRSLGPTEETAHMTAPAPAFAMAGSSDRTWLAE
jgi:site-specific recombinase XerD